MRSAFLKIFTAVLICSASISAQASQSNPVLPTSSPYPGLTMLANINSAFQAFLSNNAGASAPSYGIEGTFYTNSSSGLLEYYSGSNWLNIGKFSTTQFVPVSNGVPYTVPSSTGSANAYVVTYSPAPTAYVTGQHYPFIANFANTTTASENVNGLGAKQITKRGTVALASGDIPNGAAIDTVYDGTEMQMISQLGNAATGTVTSVTCNAGLSGGTFTTSGTCGFATIANGDFLANTSGGVAVPTQTTLTAYIDAVIGNTRGAIIERGASGWAKINPGATGTVLTSNGASADPTYQNVGGGLTLLATVNASAATSVVFGSSVITSSYHKYVVEFDGVYTNTGGSKINLTISSNNGSSYIGGTSYHYADLTIPFGTGAIGNSGSNGDSQFDISAIGGGNPGNSAARSGQGTITFSNPASGNNFMAEWRSVWEDAGATVGYGYNDNGGTPAVINNIQIAPDGGSTITGNFHLYGLSGL